MHPRFAASLLALCFFLASGCGGSSGADAGLDDASLDGGASDAGADDLGASATVDAGPSTRLGGARPATLVVPTGAGATPLPLIVLLHGYGASGVVQDAYLGFSRYTRAHGVYLVAPDGVVDSTGMRAWNATDACCGDHTTDDVAYLHGLVAEAESRFAIDTTRIYFAGHSNGGFMSYRMACDDAPEVAAIASLAGATWLDESRCMPGANVSVLQISGTADTDVPIDGTAEFPGGRASVERWATRAGCDLSMTTPGAALDLDASQPGSETSTLAWTAGCAPGIDHAFWTIEGGTHIPPVTADFAPRVIEWLLTHHR